MKVWTVVVIVMLFACLFSVGLPLQSAAAQTGPAVPFVANIFVDNSFVWPSNPSSLVLVFVPTGSKSVNCLVTLNDTTFVVLGTQVFCAQRTSRTLGRGVVVTIDYFQTVPPGYTLNFTLWQQGVTHYGQPIPCTNAEFSFC
jgi:hypothetical protein